MELQAGVCGRLVARGVHRAGLVLVADEKEEQRIRR